MVSRRVLAAAAGSLIALALAAVPARADEHIRLRIEVYGFAGIHVASSRVTIDEIGAQYAIAGDTETLGLASIFSSFHGHSQTQGHLTANSAQPETYRADIRYDEAERHDRADFRADGTIFGASTAPTGAAGNGSGAVALRGVLDPLTTYFSVERQLERGGNCTVTMPVFDGRHRYDLMFADQGQQTLEPENGQRYSGPARLCHMRRADVAGYPTDRMELARQGKLWYARLIPGDLFLPVRVEIETDGGDVTGYLTEVEGGGTSIKLMP